MHEETKKLIFNMCSRYSGRKKVTIVCLTFSLPDPMQECVIEFKQITEED